MKLIVGLGNPGKKYEKTRHNIGFMILDYYVSINKLDYKNKFNGKYCESVENGEKYIFLKPQMYMNLSGEVVLEYKRYFNISNEDIIIIYDDMDFDVGKFRIKKGGSSAGHNGIKDIINKLKTEEIARIRIGTSKTKSDIINYVLGKFSKEDLQLITNLFPTLCEVIKDISILNIEELMSKYNKKD